MRLKAILPFLLSPLTLGAVACGEDHGKVVHDIADSSGGDVSNDVGVPEGWQAALESPAETALFGAGETVNARLRLSAEGVSSWVGFKATLKLNDQVLAADTDLEIPANGVLERALGAKEGGNALVVTVTAPDGTTRELTRAFSVNIPPEAPKVGLWPAKSDGSPDVGAAADTDDELVVAVELEADATIKGTELVAVYRWVKVGSTTSLGGDNARLPASLTERGDTIEVYVMADDGLATSPEAKASIVIGNGAPTCGAVLVTPAAARVDQALTCACTDFDDPDDDAEASTCRFLDTVSGDTLGTPGSCTLPAGNLEPGMSVACEVTPHDGTDAGAPTKNTAGSNVIVLNAAPTAPVAALSPAGGNALTTFTCNLATAGTDPDGDSLTHTVKWTVNGVAHTSTATTTTAEALGAGKGEALCCTITADDGEDATASTAACTTLANASPPAVSVFIGAEGGPPATRRSTLTCTPQSAADPDGDALSIAYAWYVDGVVVAAATGATFDAGDLEKGSVVTCTATICDTDAACTDALASKNSLGIQNALPTLGGATVVTDGNEANPGDTVDCAFTGWDDPDGDAVEVTYEWVYTEGGTSTVVAGETSASLEVDAGMDAGATLACRVTPHNGDSAGAPVTSPPLVVGPAIPKAPVVAVDAPAGADGPLTCKITTAAQYIPQSATWTWRWSLNDVAVTGASAQTLGADQVSHCDLVKCWVEITGLDLNLSSNKGTQLMPLGLDCDDGNPCTSSVCLQAGGCNAIPQDGVACDDGDPCSENELCDEGKCVGTIDTCVEDRLSVAASGSRPYLAADGEDGYLTQWYDSNRKSSFLRPTDQDESRLDGEVRVLPTNITRPMGAYQHDVSPSGLVGVMRADNMPTIACNCVGNYTYGLNLRRYAADLSTFEEVNIGNLGSGVICGGACMNYPGANRAESIAFSDDAFGVLHAYHYPIGTTVNKVDLVYRRVEASLALTTPVTLVDTSVIGVMDAWDAAYVPDGSDHFVVAWLGLDKKSIKAQRFSRDGAPQYAEAVTVATSTGTLDQVAVTAMANGRFVVAWDGAGVDSAGRGVAFQRLDENGQKLGGAVIATSAESGDQLLGNVDAFDGFQFVLGWRDASTPTPKYQARVFSSAGAVAATITLNETTTVSAAAPTVEVLGPDEWVAAWVDNGGVLWTRRYQRDGSPAPRAAEFRANDEPSKMQESPSAAATQSGHVMVAYATTLFSAGGFATEIAARIFDADGLEVAPELYVHDPMANAQTTPVVAAGADRFVVVWNSEEQDGSADGLFARLYDEVGTSLGEPLPVNLTTASYQRQPAVAMATDGTWAVAWNGYTDATNLSDVYARVFPSTGAATAEVKLNSTLANVQERPSLAVVPFASELLVAWQSRSTTTGYDIVVRKLGFDGVTKSGEIPLNTTTAGDQRNPTIAAIQSGSFTVCWESVGQVTANKSVVACQRVKTSNLVPQGSEFLPLSWTNDQLSPQIRYQSNGRLAIAYQALGLDSDGFGVQLVRVNDLGAQVGPQVTANRYWTSDQSRPWLIPMDDRVFVGWQSNGQDGSEGGIFFRILPMAP